MANLLDVALLVISGCCALYCWMLSRRLRALQSLRSGVGKAVVEMTQSVTAAETNLANLNREALSAVTELKEALAQVDGCEERVDTALETLDQQSRAISKEFGEKSGTMRAQLEGASTMLRELIVDAKTMSGLLNEQLLLASRGVEAKKSSAKPSEKVVPLPRPQTATAPQASGASAVSPARPIAEGEAAKRARQAVAKKIAAVRAANRTAGAQNGPAQIDISALAKKLASGTSGGATNRAADTSAKTARANPFSAAKPAPDLPAKTAGGRG